MILQCRFSHQFLGYKARQWPSCTKAEPMNNLQIIQSGTWSKMVNSTRLLRTAYPSTTHSDLRPARLLHHFHCQFAAGPLGQLHLIPGDPWGPMISRIRPRSVLMNPYPPSPYLTITYNNHPGYQDTNMIPTMVVVIDCVGLLTDWCCCLDLYSEWSISLTCSDIQSFGVFEVLLRSNHAPNHCSTFSINGNSFNKGHNQSISSTILIM